MLKNPFLFKIFILFIFFLFFFVEFIFTVLVSYTKFNILSVGYIIGKNNFYESLISIISLLENKNDETFINIYTVVGHSLKKENIRILLSLQTSYIHLKIKIVSINKDIENFNDENKIVLLFKSIKYFKYNKILYLNSDTLIFKDLSVLFQLDFDDKYFIGPNLVSFKYVLLMNLHKLRKDKCIQNYLNLKNCLSLPDKRIEIENKFAANRIYKKIDHSWERNAKIYKYDELFNTYEFPDIYFFNETQPYLNNFNSIYKNVWHIYANKTGKYNDILLHFNLSFNINEITELKIAISFNDGYTYPTIITLASLFETSSKLTKFDIYCVVPNDYPELNKKKILSLLNIYPNKGEIHFILVSNFFPGKKFQYPHPHYYKLFYDKILPKNLEKVIYLEPDMIYLEDIRILNDLDLNNKTYLGLGRSSFIGTDEFVIVPHIINLKLIRNTNLTDLYTKFLIENSDKYKYSFIDERAINTFNQGRLGRIPMRYSALYSHIKKGNYYNRVENNEIMVITKEEYESAKKNPAYVHLTPCRPWKNINNKCKFGKKWWFLAEKSGFKNEIMGVIF